MRRLTFCTPCNQRFTELDRFTRDARRLGHDLRELSTPIEFKPCAECAKQLVAS
jgi:hypothetical protein